MDNLDLGEPIPYTTRWWDSTGAPVEPTSITITVSKPDGTISTHTKGTLTGSSSVTPAGVLDVWSLSVVGDVAGLWRFHADAKIGVDSAVPQEFMVLVGVEEATGWCGQWATWEDVTRCGAAPNLDAFGRDLVLDNATEILYLLTDRKYPGICTVTRSLCHACGHCYPSVCACDPYPSIDLASRYPILGVWDVRVGGELLDPTAYEVRGRRWLVRLDGAQWPLGTGWVANRPDLFSATWAYGRERPISGRLAAARYALELARLCADGTCGLDPQSARNVVREGITYTVLDPDSVIAEGRTGLSSVDAWIIADAVGHKPRPHGFAPALGAQRRMV